MIDDAIEKADSILSDKVVGQPEALLQARSTLSPPSPVISHINVCNCRFRQPFNNTLIPNHKNEASRQFSRCKECQVMLPTQLLHLICKN